MDRQHKKRKFKISCHSELLPLVLFLVCLQACERSKPDNNRIPFSEGAEVASNEPNSSHIADLIERLVVVDSDGTTTRVEGLSVSSLVDENGKIPIKSLASAATHGEPLFTFKEPEGYSADYSDLSLAVLSGSPSAPNQTVSEPKQPATFARSIPTLADIYELARTSELCGELAIDYRIRLSSIVDEAMAYIRPPPLKTYVPCAAESFAGIEVKLAGEFAGARAEEVNLTLSAGEYITEMYVTPEPGCSQGGQWEPFRPTVSPGRLAHHNAANTFYSAFRDVAGRVSDCISTTIIHDTTPPTAAQIAINANNAQTGSPQVLLSLAVDDANALEMYVTNSPGCSSDGVWEPLVNSMLWTLNETSGVGEVYVRFRDIAGNTTACLADNIALVPAEGGGTCSDPDLSKVMEGVEVELCNGSKGMGTLVLCTSDGQEGCVATTTFPVADITSLSAIAAGKTIAGMTGVASPLVSNCTMDGQIDCVTTLTYRAADMASFTALDLTNGKTMAGVAGSLANCAADGAITCVATTSYKAADTSAFAASSIITGKTIAGVAGSATAESHTTCSGDAQTGCVTDSTYKSADTSAFAASDLRSGRTIAGIGGDLADCSADAETGCVANASYRAANMSTFAATDIKLGVTVAGVAGSLDNCTGDAGTDCLTTSTYKAAAVSNFAATDIKSGKTIAGVAGSIANCSANGQDNCFASSSTAYDAANLTNLSAGNIKSGVTIAGVTGQYPSSTYKLPGAGTSTYGLTASNFDARMASASSFEYWDQTGARVSGAGDADIVASNIKLGTNIFGVAGSLGASYVDVSTIDPWDIRKGVTLGPLTGELKVACRNMMNPSLFNSDVMPPSNSFGTTAGTSYDWWDTLDDNNNGQSTLPSTLVTGWTSDVRCDATNWRDVTNNGSGDTTCDSAGDACVFKDLISGLYWSEYQGGGKTWEQAVTTCNDLVFAGHSDWRLPSQKELLEGHVHGLRDLTYKSGTVGTSSNNSNFLPDSDTTVVYWSGTTVSSATTQAFSIWMNDGDLDVDAKTGLLNVTCVRGP